MTIRTITVDGVTEVDFNPSGTDPLFYAGERFCWVRNLSETAMYASLDENCTTGAAGTITIPAGEAGMLELTPDNAVYINGTGSAEVRTQDFPDCPFKKQAKGGGESVLIEKSVTANGVYSAAGDSADGYSRVTVSVTPNLGTKSVTANGTYAASGDNLDGYSSVTVAVPSKVKGQVILYELHSSSESLGITLPETIDDFDELCVVCVAWTAAGFTAVHKRFLVSEIKSRALGNVTSNIGITSDDAYRWLNIYANRIQIQMSGRNFTCRKIVGIKWRV